MLQHIFFVVILLMQIKAVNEADLVGRCICIANFDLSIRNMFILAGAKRRG
jgi:hypothetical protein